MEKEAKVEKDAKAALIKILTLSRRCGSLQTIKTDSIVSIVPGHRGDQENQQNF
ncbi:MAG: hypothetical protein WCO22_01020 [Betaproteobacteria bacterium]